MTLLTTDEDDETTMTTTTTSATTTTIIGTTGVVGVGKRSGMLELGLWANSVG
jgi:hypothetical protein